MGGMPPQCWAETVGLFFRMLSIPPGGWGYILKDGKLIIFIHIVNIVKNVDLIDDKKIG